MKLLAGLEYKLFKKGPVTSNLAEGGAFWFADKEAATADLQFHFLPAAGVEAGVPAGPVWLWLYLKLLFPASAQPWLCEAEKC